MFDDKEHIYIVDFVNHEKFTVTEIKPKEFLNTRKERAKINALERWCNDNKYQMNIITQDDIEYMATLVCIDDFDDDTQRKIKVLNEAYKKNRDR